MFNKQLKANIKELDLQIGKLNSELAVCVDQEAHELKMTQIESVTKVRCQLAESKVAESHAGTIISGVLGIASVLMVLNYEKSDIVTSKAFGIATKLFKGA